MAATVEHRFRPVNRMAEPSEWLADNGSPYVAGDDGRFARDIGLVTRTTPVSSPQSNGMGWHHHDIAHVQLVTATG